MLHLHPAVQLSTVKSGGAWKAADLNELQRYRTRNDERDRSGLQRETRRGCFWPLWPPSDHQSAAAFPSVVASIRAGLSSLNLNLS